MNEKERWIAENRDTLPRYHVYMLRFWESHPQWLGGPTSWRFSLEDPASGVRRGFSDLEGLIAFLQAEMGRPEPKQ